MPQMFPIMWLTLFSMINLSLVVVINMMYYSMKPSFEAKDNVLKNSSHNWKW